MCEQYGRIIRRVLANNATKIRLEGEERYPYAGGDRRYCIGSAFCGFCGELTPLE